MANYQWYPGHMTKARRMIEEDMRLVDVVIEVLDARIPYASRNPDIDRLSQGKGRVVILNKADLAERSATEAWIRYFAEKSIPAVALDARKSGISSSLSPAIREASAPVREKLRRRGMKERPMRVL
ncbi:MAG: ribosome biogenesis GTPase YlqF, partial [Lachnospiraceae bacterium]|nr:ribosome biogenesis GTPase YlqF [Lachnospiraceae bacterium]